MVGKMLFGNEAAHILVATSRRAEKRQESLGVGRVPRQLKGFLHAVFDGSRCTLDGNATVLRLGTCGTRRPGYTEADIAGWPCVAIDKSEQHTAFG
jgi:hypothetical protein